MPPVLVSLICKLIPIVRYAIPPTRARCRHRRGRAGVVQPVRQPEKDGVAYVRADVGRGAVGELMVGEDDVARAAPAAGVGRHLDLREAREELVGAVGAEVRLEGAVRSRPYREVPLEGGVDLAEEHAAEGGEVEERSRRHAVEWARHAVDVRVGVAGGGELLREAQRDLPAAGDGDLTGADRRLGQRPQRRRAVEVQDRRARPPARGRSSAPAASRSGSFAIPSSPSEWLIALSAAFTCSRATTPGMMT